MFNFDYRNPARLACTKEKVMDKIVLKDATVTVEQTADGTVLITMENPRVKKMKYEVSATFEVDTLRRSSHIAVHLNNVTEKDDDIPH